MDLTGEGFELPLEMITELADGDERCKYPVGSRVVKNIKINDGQHKRGTRGTVLGSIMIENPMTGRDIDAYVIHYDGDPEENVGLVTGPVLLSIDEFESLS